MALAQEICVYAAQGCEDEGLRALAEKLNTEIIFDEERARSAQLTIWRDEQGLSLISGNLSLRGDLTDMLPRLKRSNMQHEMLIKAARLKHMDPSELTVLDATAGMGEDSLLLAAAGFRVELYEYDPVIAALLEDSLRRGAEHPELADIVSRMHLHNGDSIAAMEEIAGRDSEKPDVILLDPMFPERTKSAMIKKKFQLLQKLEQPCCEEGDLLSAAMRIRPKRIVIKRPAKGPYLAGVKPEFSYSGKAIRYDCLVFHTT